MPETAVNVTPDPDQDIEMQTYTISKIEMFLTGDISFYSYVLGKEGSSSAYCPYCPLTKEEWTCLLHTKHPQLTIKSYTAMPNDTSIKGPRKKGVKCCPASKMIAVDHCTISLTHLGFGVDNNGLNLFWDRVEWHILNLPLEEEAMQTR